MTKVSRDGAVMVARDDTQLDAFLNNGWSVVVEETATPSDNKVTAKASKDDTSKHSKSEINRMSKNDLVSLANEIGIDGADDMFGRELKTAIIEKMGL